MKRKSRGLAETQTPNRDPSGTECDEPETQHSKAGRPPIGEQAMTPNTYSKRRRSQMSASYNKQKTSKARSQAASKGWQSRALDFGGEGSSKDETVERSSNNESAEDVTVQTQSDQEQEVPTDDTSVAEQPADPQQSNVSARTHRRHKQMFRDHLTDNALVNLDLFVHYCKSNSSIIDIDTST